MRFLAFLFAPVLLVACKQSEQAALSDHFNRPLKESRLEFLSSPFSVEKPKQRERTELPGGFLRPVKRKDKTPVNSKTTQKDSFSRTVEQRERSEEDLSGTFNKTNIRRKNFIGEPFRLFNRDPNRKKHKKAKRKKPRDPFGRKKRIMHKRQAPKNEGDLFQNGVLPKMKDTR